MPRSPSDSSSKGGRSLPGLDVKASPRRELRTGLVTAACDSEESCKEGGAGEGGWGAGLLLPATGPRGLGASGGPKGNAAQQ